MTDEQWRDEFARREQERGRRRDAPTWYCETEEELLVAERLAQNGDTLVCCLPGRKPWSVNAARGGTWKPQPLPEVLPEGWVWDSFSVEEA